MERRRPVDFPLLFWPSGSRRRTPPIGTPDRHRGWDCRTRPPWRLRAVAAPNQTASIAGSVGVSRWRTAGDARLIGSGFEMLRPGAGRWELHGSRSLRRSLLFLFSFFWVWRCVWRGAGRRRGAGLDTECGYCAGVRVAKQKEHEGAHEHHSIADDNAQAGLQITTWVKPREISRPGIFARSPFTEL